MQEADELKRMELETKKELYLKRKEEAERAKQAAADGGGGTAGKVRNSGPVLRFEVKPGAKDLWQFSMYHAMGGMKGLFNVIFTLAALFLLVTRWDQFGTGYRLLLGVCVLTFTVWQPLLLYYKAGKQAKTPAMQQSMYLTFDDNGLKVEQNERQATFTWEQMGRMDRISSMIILYMDRVHAYLLPNEAMGEQKEQLCEMARTHLQPNQRRKI